MQEDKQRTEKQLLEAAEQASQNYSKLLHEKENLHEQLSKTSSSAEEVIDQVTQKYQELKEENQRLVQLMEGSQNGDDNNHLEQVIV